MAESALCHYNKKEVSEIWSEYSEIQAPEKAILDIISGNLKLMKTLDIGVGAGRTTSFFIDKVNQYVGIDIADEMIKTCNKRFQRE